MKSKLMRIVFLGLAFSFTLAVTARQAVNLIEPPTSTSPSEQDDPANENQLRDPSGVNGPVNAIGAIAVPGGVGAVDILWVDQPRGRGYIADRTKAAVHIIDAINSVYVDQVPGFVGAIGASGGRGGPNGVVVTPDNFLWVGDGNSLLQAVDLNVSPPRIGHTVPLGNAVAYGRADELAYDPIERVILIASDAAHPPKATFVSADSYSVLGKIEFPDADGLEQPAWDSQLHRFLLTVPGSPAYVAVIDPRRMRVTKKFIINRSCNASGTVLTLGLFQRILAVACGSAYIMSAIDGHIISSITQVGGGDEVWYNPGDNRYYVTSADRTANLGQSLGVIDAATSTWLQNVPAPNIRNIAVYAGNNHIFSASTHLRPGSATRLRALHLGWLAAVASWSSAISN